MKSYDLNLLLALDALLSTASVTAAARRLHLSTPAMSHTLARIREVFGDPILVRAGRQLVPTPRALALAEPVRQVLERATALRAAPPDQALPGTRRHFVLRAPDGVSVAFSAPLLQAVQTHMPEATLQLLSEVHSDASGLREGRIDLDIGTVRTRDPEIVVEELYRLRQVGTVRVGHPLLAARVTARRYAAARHVSVELRPHEHSPVDAALASLGLQRSVVLRMPNSYGALIAVSRSDLVATVGERIARATHSRLGLALFDLPLKLKDEATVMAWHPRHAADAAHQCLRECVRRVLNEGYLAKLEEMDLFKGGRAKNAAPA